MNRSRLFLFSQIIRLALAFALLSSLAFGAAATGKRKHHATQHAQAAVNRPAVKSNRVVVQPVAFAESLAANVARVPSCSMVDG